MRWHFVCFSIYVHEFVCVICIFMCFCAYFLGRIGRRPYCVQYMNEEADRLIALPDYNLNISIYL